MNLGTRLWRSSVRRLITLGLTVAATSSLAADRSSVGTSHLQRDLRGLSTRVERAPRASTGDLKRAERRLHDQWIDTPRDPRLPRLEIEIRDLRWQADRAARRRIGTAARGAPPAVTISSVAKPRYLGGSHTRTPEGASALDLGQRVIALQADLRLVDEHLRRGEAVAAAELLASAAAGLERLRGGLSPTVADDPNLVALDRQIGALEARLGPPP